MKHLKSYKIFESTKENKTLFIFDFDDTLMFSPSFNDKVSQILNENITTKDLLDRSLSFLNLKADTNLLKIDNDQIYILDPEHKIEVRGNWNRKGDKIFLITPHMWSKIEDSFSNKKTPLSNLYNSVENKCIVTARPKDSEELVIKKLKELNLDDPNYGLYTMPLESGVGNPGAWKAKQIIKIIKETNFEKYLFYDDNKKVLNRVDREVNDYFKTKILTTYLVKDGNII